MSSPMRLDAVCDISMGQAPSGDAYNYDGEGWPLIAGAGDFGETYPVVKKYTTVAARLSKPGDIVLGIRASIGEKVIADGEYCLGRGVAGLRAGPGLNSRYLWHWLTHAGPRLASKAKGATFKQVNKDDIGELDIVLPPLSDQRRIAAILDQADALRAKRREALAKLDSLTQSIFIEMFGDPATNPKGWPVRNIGDLLESASYGTSEKSSSDGQFAVLRMNNITRTGDIDLTDLKYMDLTEREYDRYLVKTGDVLFNRTNSAELVGKTAVYRHTEPMAYAGYLIRLRTSDDNDPEYLGRFLNTPYAKRMLRGMCKSIIGMANINATEIQAMKIPQPPKAFQQQFGSRLRTVEGQKAKHRESLAVLDTLFASLQHRAFLGEL